MTGEHVWLRHPTTGGSFNCPAEAVEDWRAMGWDVADEPPIEQNPVTAEHLAWREEQAKQTAKPTKPAARRGETTTGEMSNG